jgi:hypothetical protein
MMHPQFRIDLLHQRSDEFLRAARHAHFEPAPAPWRPSEAGIALRLCRVDDDPALERLAVLDGGQAPAGRYVIVEVDGVLAAAQPLSGGAPLADPFQPTAHLLPLLALRAAQLDPDQPRRTVTAAKAIAARMLHPAR